MCRRFSSLVIVGLDGFIPALDGGTFCSLLTRASRRMRRTRGGESGGCAVRGKHNFMWIIFALNTLKTVSCYIIKYAMDFNDQSNHRFAAANALNLYHAHSSSLQSLLKNSCHDLIAACR